MGANAESIAASPGGFLDIGGQNCCEEQLESLLSSRQRRELQKS